jgi:pimeloyl-ACP methyl ester carboxylesterase
MTLADQGHIEVDGARLAYRMIGPRPDAAPMIVMLHEGLGAVSTWGEFPAKLAERSAFGVFLYSRAGYGQSSTITLPRPLDYMQREAAEVLPKLLDAIGFRRGILLGHSDGASIAAQYAGTHQDHRVRALVLIAPKSATRAPPTRRPTCGRGSRGITRTSMRRSAAGTRRGSTRGLRARSISPRRSPTSACRSWWSRARPTVTARWRRSAPRRRSAIARSKRW